MGRPRVSSPTTTSLSEANDAKDVLSAAAGQVARLKIKGEASGLDFQNRGPLGGGGGVSCAFTPPIAMENRHTPLNLSQVRTTFQLFVKMLT